MALGSNSSSNTTWLSIFGGKIAQRIKEDEYNRLKDENVSGYQVIERENKKGDTVYEKHFDFVEGRIEKAGTEETPFGINITLEIDDVGETYKLSMGLDSRYGKDFMNKFVNLDLSEPTYISPFSFEADNGKRYSGVTLMQ